MRSDQQTLFSMDPDPTTARRRTLRRAASVYQRTLLDILNLAQNKRIGAVQKIGKIRSLVDDALAQAGIDLLPDERVRYNCCGVDFGTEPTVCPKCGLM
jgi:hypothetical protein